VLLVDFLLIFVAAYLASHAVGEACRLSRRGRHDMSIHIILPPLSFPKTLTPIVEPACHLSSKPSKATIRRTLTESGAATEPRE